MAGSQYCRSPEGEANRLAALRSAESRQKISDAKKGVTPANFSAAQQSAWAANRKEVLTYSGIHAWVKRNWGKADRCELCGKSALAGCKVHWASKDHKYSRNRKDWMMACRPCHAAYDQEHNGVDFGSRLRRAKTHCPQGHEYTPENTKTYTSGRQCVACKQERAKARRLRKKSNAQG
jgi:hypothetical protein